MRNIYISFAPSDWEGRELSSYIQHTLTPLGVEVIGHNHNKSWNQEIESPATTLINKCDVFLCYPDTSNPNVMFELGYALGANKKVFIIGDAKTIPSDLRNTLYIKRGASPFEIIEHLERHVNLYSTPQLGTGTTSLNPTEAIESLTTRQDLLGSIEPGEFEEIVFNWFSEKGFRVESNWHGRDSGYDFAITTSRGERALVEVKKYKQTSQVPVSTIRQMVGSMAFANTRYGVIVSSAPFTQAAKYFASEIGQKLILLTLEDLANMKNLDHFEIENGILS